MVEKWIRGAIRHPGALKEWAGLHRFMRADGTIDLARAERYATKHGLTHRLEEIRLAQRLEKMRHRRKR